MIKTNIPNGFVAWHVPPCNRGQTVEVAYGIDEDGECWEREIDRSGPTTSYRHLGHVNDASNTDWEPWNRTPAIARAGT